MPLSTSIRDNLLHIITINPEVVVLRRHSPCLLQVPASSSTTALSANASNEQTNEQNTNLVLRNGFPPTAVLLRIVASRANRLLHHSVVAVVTPFGTFEIDSIGSINLATSLQISQIKSICSVPVISFCVLLLNCANHPLIHRLVFRRCQISVRFQLKFRATSAIIIIIIMDGWMLEHYSHACTHIYLHIETTGGCVGGFRRRKWRDLFVMPSSVFIREANKILFDWCSGEKVYTISLCWCWK